MQLILAHESPDRDELLIQVARLHAAMPREWGEPADKAEELATVYFDFLKAHDKPQLVLCLVEGGTVRAFHWLRGTSPKTVEIYSTWVDPSRRREGHASRLKQAGLEHAARLGFVKLVSRVRCANAAMVALNERHGFRPSVLVMERPI